MATNFQQPRRDSGPIKSVVNGQKPSCVVEIYKYQDPDEKSLSLLNVQSDKASGKANTKSTKSRFIIDNDIVKCTIHKNKNSSSGGFSLILKRGNKGDHGQFTTGNPIDYLKLISPGDWLSIYMRSDDKNKVSSRDRDSGLKMLGIIENVRYVEFDDPNTGRPKFEYVVTGRDFGKIFENQVYFNPVINALPKINKVIAGSFISFSDDIIRKRGALSPDEVCKLILQFFLASDEHSIAASTPVFLLPDQVLKDFSLGRSKGRFIDILDLSFIGRQKYKSASRPGGIKTEQVFSKAEPLQGKTYTLSMPPSGTVFSYVQMYSNPALNEIVVDLALKDGKLRPTIQLRQMPLSHSSSDDTNPFKGTGLRGKDLPDSKKTLLKSLPQHIILSTDVKQKNIGKSQFERINAVVVVPQKPEASGQEIREAYAMMINKPSVQKYGLSLLRLNTIFTADGNLKDTGEEHTLLVTDMFMNSHAFYNGTIVTDGTDDFVQVGQNLLIEDLQQLFHIEGLSYLYEIDQNTGTTTYNTEFRVSNGQTLRGGKLGFIGDIRSGSRAGSKQEALEYNTISSQTLENLRND